MTFAAVPGGEKVGETIVAETSDLARYWQTQQSCNPRMPRCTPPDLNCAVGADEYPPFGINPVQPAPHVLDPGTVTGERRGLQIDIAKLDGAGSTCAQKPLLLPFDAAITDGAFGIVPDDEFGTHRRTSPEAGLSQR